ncbi:Potassium-transporting ATPase KdpC subunit [Baekduia alba]|uniref:potassium-transporting ATPase subunit C n=1 Tax=Baekduia alba TaxID=2997333 RepID=UPI002340A801|nr:potassium-transporting ATPase subunit C [Baekduia alba]WCB93324.1 Potassium-transporting ATPase KdpC subunit [Baekduia alba]
MRKDLIRGSLVVVVFTVLLGLVYPLVMTGIAQVAFPSKADGSLVRKDGKVTGSTLLGQAWQKPVLDSAGKPKKDSDGNDATEADPKYFQPRPSATGYSASVTYFGNHGPNQSSTMYLTRQNLQAYLALEQPYDKGLKADQVPVDAATFSASGVDPHISKANAAIQANRIAAVRHLSLARVQQLMKDNTDGRGLGVFGEPGVNVTKINLALDQEAR